jgi:hypothetical protein
VRTFVVSAVLGAGLVAVTASCAVPQPAAAVAVSEPIPIAPTPAPASVPVVVAAQPSPAPVVATAPTPREVEYVPLPGLWWRMLAAPAPAGRLMLNNFSFAPTLVQAAFAAEPGCAIGDPGTATEFVLPPNGTRVIPAPPGIDICWRRQLIAGETTGTPPTEPWTAWSRAYTGPERFLDAVVVTPSPLAFAVVEKAPAPPPPSPPPMPSLPPK